MNNNLVKAYSLLDITDKKNELSEELMIIGEILNVLNRELELNKEISIKNYNNINDGGMTEDETLVYYYDDIHKIKENLLDILAVVNGSVKDEEDK